MENQNFKKALAFTLKWEGGYSNDKDDPGQETNFGISKKANPDVDPKKLTLDQASEIYWDRYWMPSNSYSYLWPLSAVIFDSAVLHGVQTSKLILQRAMKESKDSNPETIALKLCDIRLELFDKIIKAKPRMKKYLKGWRNRIADLKNLVTSPEIPVAKKKKMI